MKNTLLIAVLFTVLLIAENALAVSHSGAGGNESIQPAAPSDLYIDLSKSDDREILETLLQKLKDPDPFKRVEAVQALGEIHLEESLIAVCNSLDDENIYVRAYAAEAIGKIGQVDVSLALLRLLPALDDPSPFVRAMILQTLGELQDTRAADSIKKLLDDEDESVRGMAAWALNKIENKY